jgi:hypothetical protein
MAQGKREPLWRTEAQQSATPPRDSTQGMVASRDRAYRCRAHGGKPSRPPCASSPRPETYFMPPLSPEHRNVRERKTHRLSSACAIPGTILVPPITRTACKYFRIFSSPPAARALLKTATSSGSFEASNSTSIGNPPGKLHVGSTTGRAATGPRSRSRSDVGACWGWPRDEGRGTSCGGSAAAGAEGSGLDSGLFVLAWVSV